MIILLFILLWTSLEKLTETKQIELPYDGEGSFYKMVSNNSPQLTNNCIGECENMIPVQIFEKYAAKPGEIIFTLREPWSQKLTDQESSTFKILKGNVENAVKYVLGSFVDISDLYFTKGYIKGNISPIPKVVVHLKVNGGSDPASLLELSVGENNVLGDGLLVYKDTFFAF